MSNPPRPAKPFVKWVGGKRSILDTLVDRAPQSYQRYVEPFVGGGALFFRLQPAPALLADINERLITTYQALRDDVDQVIALLTQHAAAHSADYYYQARVELSAATDPAQVAAWFIYLNKTCYNGLYRVNRRGGFNVPLGDYTDPPILDEPNLRAAATALQGVELTHGAFDAVEPRTGDFCYLDPPYHQTYAGYSAAMFGEAEHVRLAAYCDRIDTAGGRFLLSNSDTPLVRELYATYTIEVVSAGRSVSREASQRGRADELLVRNY